MPFLFLQPERRGSTVGTEVRGAVATFLTMAYVLVANPSILAAAGVPVVPAVAGTAAAAAIASILMGVVADFPLALASGMGLNAVIAFQIAPAVGSWQTAMGLVVLDGLVVLALVLFGLREAVMRAIPHDLRLAIGVGIGLFIAFIGAVNARLVVVPAGTIAVLGHTPTAVLPPVTYGSLHAPEAIVALVGTCLTAALVARRVTGAIVIGIVASTVLAFALGIASLPAGGLLASPRFDTFAQANLRGALAPGALALLLPIMLVDFFDTIGTATAIAEEAGLEDDEGRIPGLKRVLAIDALAASIGGLFGVSSVTAYIESAAGVAEGARTGLHSIVVGLLFALAMFAAPLAAVVPAAATAPALIIVGFLMCAQVTRIDFRTAATGIPAFVLLATIPFTYSISHGIGYGFITYTVVQLLGGRWRELHPLMLGASLLFAAYFVFG
ncbi:Xanthine/uracil/vitamin C permease (plasmid) [Gemmatirosa kalamazoonensis]|uniref:Xanthine/uracil/vitamin C permease n=1 Tax=Gemmatirosa kalamazoonensis TaxID=861299 RepID=W0RTW3_9BACT|nr:NCS2 family permease [Gemmatirosa kalamazoonensis]AHG93902.1 Xanthine/uracil/vitamin C permease [Gemmatirosa kalamazoonensis]